MTQERQYTQAQAQAMFQALCSAKRFFDMVQEDSDGVRVVIDPLYSFSENMLHNIIDHVDRVLKTTDSAATSATEPSVAVANGARYVARKNPAIKNLSDVNWDVWDSVANDWMGRVFTGLEASIEANRLNAAHPASGTDTVAGRYTLELAENEQTKALGFKPLGYFIVDNVDKTTHGFYSLDDKSDGQAEVNRLNTGAANAETGEA